MSFVSVGGAVGLGFGVEGAELRLLSCLAAVDTVAVAVVVVVRQARIASQGECVCEP